MQASSARSRGPRGHCGRTLPEAREPFCRELSRRLLLFSQELAGLAGDSGSREERKAGELAGAIDRLMGAVRELERELSAARRRRDRPWGEIRAALEDRWREFRGEFERLAVAAARSHAAAAGLGTRRPRR